VATERQVALNFSLKILPTKVSIDMSKDEIMETGKCDNELKLEDTRYGFRFVFPNLK